MKKVIALILCMLLLVGTVFTAGAEADTQPEVSYDEAAILDAIAESWIDTCNENMKWCAVGMGVYGFVQPLDQCKEDVIEEFSDQLKTAYTGSGVVYELSVEDLNDIFGDDTLSRQIHTYMLYQGAEEGTDEHLKMLAAKADVESTIKNKKGINGEKVLDLLKENYSFIIGAAGCETGALYFKEAIKTDDLATKRAYMLQGAMFATFGCGMSISDTDKLTKAEYEGVKLEDVMVEIAESGMDMVSNLVPEIGILKDTITITADVLLKTWAIDNKMNALRGFLDAPETIEENWSSYYNALSNRYGKYTFEISEGLEVTMSQYNGYLDVGAAYEEVVVPEEIYGFPVVAFGGVFVEDKPIREFTVPSTVTSRSYSTVVKNCDKLEKLYYNAPNCGVWSLGYFITGCDSDFDVIFGPGIEMIPGRFISECGLSEIAFPEDVKTIHAGALRNCPNLKTVTIPKSVELFDIPFGEPAIVGGCENLETIYYNAKQADTNSYYNAVFSDCGNGVEELTIDFGQEVMWIPNTFIIDCGIKTLDFPEGLTRIREDAVLNCQRLESITIPSTVTVFGVNYISDYIFKNCNSLKTVNYNAKNAVSEFGGYIFDSIGSDFTVNFGTGIQLIPKNFMVDCGLTEITFPEGVKTINEQCLVNCAELKTVTVPTTVESFAYNFISSSPKLETIYYNANCTSAPTSAMINNCGNYDDPCMKIIFGGQITNIPEHFITNCAITELVYPEGVKTIGQYSIQNCSALEKVVIPSTVEKISYATVANCNSLNLVEYNAVNAVRGDSYGYVFDNCGNNHGLNFQIADDVKILPYKLINNCGVLSFVIPDSVTTVSGYVIHGCKDLTALTIGSGVTTIANRAFSDCYYLTEIRYNAKNAADKGLICFVFNDCGKNADGITLTVGAQVQRIPAYLFCPIGVDYGSAPKLVRVEFEEGSVCTQIGEGAFGSCKTLTYVEFPESLVTIEKNAFFCCAGLAEAALSGKLLTIGEAAFSGCTGLKEITFKGGAPTIATYAFKDVEATAWYPAYKATWTRAVRQDYKGTITWVPIKKDIDVSRMILGNSLEFQFGVAKFYMSDTTGFYAVVEKEDTVKTIPATQWGSAGQYWAIVYDDLAAKEMADEISVTIYNADGEAISNAKTDSVRTYVARAFDNQTAKCKTMMVDMLNYGAAAQVTFNYNTADLANNQLTDTQKAWGTQTVAATADSRVEGTNYMGTRLVLEGSIQMQVAFKGMNRTMYAVYSYTDHFGNEQSVTVKGEDFIEVSGLFGVELSQLVYADARQLVTIRIYNAKGVLLSTVQDSIEGYVNRNGETDSLYDALIKFTDSAKAYLH